MANLQCLKVGELVVGGRSPAIERVNRGGFFRQLDLPSPKSWTLMTSLEKPCRHWTCYVQILLLSILWRDTCAKCVYVYIYTYIDMHIYIHIYIYQYIHTCTYTHIHTWYVYYASLSLSAYEYKLHRHTHRCTIESTLTYSHISLWYPQPLVARLVQFPFPWGSLRCASYRPVQNTWLLSHVPSCWMRGWVGHGKNRENHWLNELIKKDWPWKTRVNR